MDGGAWRGHSRHPRRPMDQWILGEARAHRGSQVFLHVFDPEADPIVLKRLPQTVVAAATLKGEAVPFVQDDVAGTVSVTIPEHARDPSVSIIKLTLDSEVTGVLYQPALAAGRIEDVPGTLSFLPENADRTGAVMAGGESPVLRNWSDPEDLVSWSLEIDSPGTYTIELTTSAARPGCHSYGSLWGKKITLRAHSGHR